MACILFLAFFIQCWLWDLFVSHVVVPNFYRSVLLYDCATIYVSIYRWCTFGLFLALSIIYNAAMNICAHVSWSTCIHISFESTPKSIIAGSWMIIVFVQPIRWYQWIFQNGFYQLISTHSSLRVLCFTSLPVLTISSHSSDWFLFTSHMFLLVSASLPTSSKLPFFTALGVRGGVRSQLWRGEGLPWMILSLDFCLPGPVSHGLAYTLSIDRISVLCLPLWMHAFT